jgi:hypothetical protein
MRRTDEQVLLISMKLRNIGALSLNACYLLKFYFRELANLNKRKLYRFDHIIVWFSICFNHFQLEKKGVNILYHLLGMPCSIAMHAFNNINCWVKTSLGFPCSSSNSLYHPQHNKILYHRVFYQNCSWF